MSSALPAVDSKRPAAAACSRLLLILVAAVTLAGCANFRAVSAFAAQTSALTGTVRTEFTELDKLCVELAELAIVLNKIDDDAPLNDCERLRAGQGRLAGVTVGVLDNYARALAALADDRSFDLSPEIQNVGSRLQNLRDRNGRPLANPQQIGALTKVVDLLADLVTSAQREAAIRRMVAETPNLKIIGDLLKSFFVGASDSGARTRPPYVNLIAIASSSARSAETTLNHPKFQEAEPIRSTELRRQLQVRKQAIAVRSGEGVDRVPMQVAAAIDAWQLALDQFAVDALKADPRALYERLTELRDKTLAAQDAVSGLRH